VNEEHKTPASGPTSGLGELLSLGLTPPEEWTPAELQAALREQMVVPVEFELGAFRPADATAVRARATANGLVLKNLHDLLQHPRPPLEMLVMAKDYFKASILRPNPEIPGLVARVLYHITIAVAWLRHQTRISTLSDTEVVEALKWVERQPWVSSDLKTLTTMAANDLTVKQGKGNP
jgi:hypothetical protein